MSKPHKDQQSPSGTSRTSKVRQLGDFELKKKLGQGGMGEVFLARQISLDRLVALKTLSRELSLREDFVQRFLREARAMARLDHPNVVRVFAVDSFRGIHFAAIEFIDGQSVQNWLDQLGRFEVGDAVHIAIVCAEALHHAHQQNMIHRDIKPDNILVTRKGIVKVADFGLAKTMDEDVSMTQSGTGLGTPLYMAPEQARNAKHVDQRTDIYALGVTLYHMLTGSLPYQGESLLELITAKEKGTFPAARSLRAGIPERLDLIIDRMMAREPGHRYRACEELIRDLTALGVHHAALSFIEDAEPVVPGSTAIRSAVAVTAGAGLNVTSTPAARAATDSGSEQRKTAGIVPVTTRVWYVQFENGKGETVVEKHSTGRVLKMINAGILTAKARGKASADGAYMPLAQFPEFSEAVENQLAHRAATIRREDMSSLYAKVARAEASRHRWRGARNMVRGFVGWTSLLIWIAVIGSVVAAGVYFVPMLVHKAAAGLGLTGDESTPGEPVIAPPLSDPVTRRGS